MIKLSGWMRIILTWVVIIPNLILSYHALHNPYLNIEIMSLTLNFIATTVLYYIYIGMSNDLDYEDEEGGQKAQSEEPTETAGLYKLAFGSLIEDMLVWMGLFFLLYNIVPLTLYVHNFVGKNI